MTKKILAPTKTCYASAKNKFFLVRRYGVQLILEDRDKEEKEYTPAVLVIVFFGVLSGAQNMGLTSPHLEAFAIARGSAAAIFNVIDRVPTIDSLSKEGQRLDSVRGEIEFRNVVFRYPARKDVQVLEGLNLKINRGETVALVGESGCGKSTCLQLAQRLYDPLDGQVSDLLIGFFLLAQIIRFERIQHTQYGTKMRRDIKFLNIVFYLLFTCKTCCKPVYMKFFSGKSIQKAA